MKKLLFIGATGMLGIPVVHELLAAGFEISALVRNKEKAQVLLPPQVRLIEGDMQSEADLKKSLFGQEVVYLNLSVRPGEKKKDFHTETNGLKLLLPLVKESRIQRIGFLSSLVKNMQGVDGFHWWVFDVKEEAVRLLKESNVPYTIFYPSTFMENFDKGGYVQGDSIVLAGTSHHPMFWIAGRDYGKQVVKAFLNPAAENKEYIVQGPEAYTVEEAAKIYANACRGKACKVIKVPYSLMKVLQVFDNKFKYFAKIVFALNHKPEPFEAEQTWKELGKPNLTLQEYAKQTSPLVVIEPASVPA